MRYAPSLLSIGGIDIHVTSHCHRVRKRLLANLHKAVPPSVINDAYVYGSGVVCSMLYGNREDGYVALTGYGERLLPAGCTEVDEVMPLWLAYKDVVLEGLRHGRSKKVLVGSLGGFPYGPMAQHITDDIQKGFLLQKMPDGDAEPCVRFVQLTVPENEQIVRELIHEETKLAIPASTSGVFTAKMALIAKTLPLRRAGVGPQWVDDVAAAVPAFGLEPRKHASSVELALRVLLHGVEEGRADLEAHA